MIDSFALLWVTNLYLLLQALFIFFAVALLTGAFLGLILHYTCTLLVEWLPQSIWPTALSSHKDNLGDEATKLKLKSQVHDSSRGTLEDKSSYNDSDSLKGSFAGWNNIKDMNLFGGRQFLSNTILEEEEYSEDSGGY